MTHAPLPSPPTTGRRRATREREFRRLRILAMAATGWSYAAIGREEAVSRERVRQFVALALEAGEREGKLVHARVQIARLEPTLRLAARSVAHPAYDENARKRLLTKLNTMAENSSGTGRSMANPRQAKTTRQSPRSPLTLRKRLTRKGYALPKACRALTKLDRT
jgi:hypothetical protein